MKLNYLVRIRICVHLQSGYTTPKIFFKSDTCTTIPDPCKQEFTAIVHVCIYKT